MARLINTIDDLKRHIALAASFDFGKVLPHAKRAERKLLALIGSDQYETFTEMGNLSDPESIPEQVRFLFEEAVANYGLLAALPSLQILITNSGLKRTDNPESQNAEWRDKQDLSRSLLNIYREAIDEAFRLMEQNQADFPDWVQSDCYSVFSELVVKETRHFQDVFDIQNNRETFFALRPFIRESEEQYLLPLLGSKTLELLKRSSQDQAILRGQELARAAAVNFSVAKSAETGPFLFTSSAMVVTTDVQPWEKVRLELSEEKLARLRSARQRAGEEYLKMLKSHILNNTALFPDYVDKTELGITAKLIKKKSGLTL